MGNKESTDSVNFFIQAFKDFWVTGGGKIGKGKPQWTFGGVAGYVEGGSGGQYQITDHRAGTNPCHYVPSDFEFNEDDNSVTFHASSECGDYYVEIIDNGSGGGKNKTADEIYVYDDNHVKIYGGYLDGGNFTIHTE